MKTPGIPTQDEHLSPPVQRPITIPFVVGAYASEPADQWRRGAYAALLRETDWVSGLELPYPGQLASDAYAVAQSLDESWVSNVVTAIPGTMQRIAGDARFGLASPDGAGRRSAIDFTRKLRDAVHTLADVKGRAVVAAVELHSAPTQLATSDAFRASLEEVLAWDWAGARLVVEHCDRWTDAHSPEKGFLSLDDEIEIARTVGVGVTVNWGRACLEARSDTAALSAVRAARRAGVLQGLMFSGVSAQASPYGDPWADAHLPAADDEALSLMTSTSIAACTSEASQPVDGIPSVRYLGAKISAPPDADIAERLRLLETIARAANAPVAGGRTARTSGR